MGSLANRTRAKWQDYSGYNAAEAEKIFFQAFSDAFEGTNYRVRAKPNEFALLYVNVNLSQAEIDSIYNPPKPVTKHGVSPDYAIDNLETKKTLYVEVKRQDGWVEGKKRKDGRGNAHERSCKYFTPGLIDKLRDKGGIAPPALPFWTVFQGDISRDPCRVREITLWYTENFKAHYFFWREAPNPEALLDHFEYYLKNLLD